MSKNLIQKGNLKQPIILWNRTKARAVENSEAIGHSIVADTLEEVVTKSDVIWTCLLNQEAVSDTFAKILAYDVRGKLFIDCSTVLPDITSQVHQSVQEAGADFIAMPGDLSFQDAKEIY
jgi:3-hydroxyisobutyrate dehydrogenase-like beta-hydroxyacid dehydrogenase